MVLFYWAAIGVVAGVIAHLYLRMRGEEGYQIIGETLLGCVGGMTTGMTLGVIFGWRHIDLESGAGRRDRRGRRDGRGRLLHHGREPEPPARRAAGAAVRAAVAIVRPRRRPRPG